MTPSARLAAAIENLDRILAGEPAERALTRWARASRFAGSKDRAAVRDIVFDCLRKRRSLAHLAGVMTGRGLVMAHQYKAGETLDELFTGEGFAPAPLTGPEWFNLSQPAGTPLPIALDYPDFLHEELVRSLGDQMVSVLSALRERAPVDLRVNTLKASVQEALNHLGRDQIFAEPHPLSPTALRITHNERRLAQSLAYRYGEVELQDVSSQAVALFAGAEPGMRVLDYCAGGGGKTLALAATMQNQGLLLAHDANPARMKDLPERASRAGADMVIVETPELERQKPQCDVVLVDAPCSGSGAWRRNPNGKWILTPERLLELTRLQSEILDEAAGYVAPGGRLVYATCSIFISENADRIDAFLDKRTDWHPGPSKQFLPTDGGDGFFVAVIEKNNLK